MMLTRDQILAAADLPTKDIDVPEWGGSARIRALTAGDALAWTELTDGEGRIVGAAGLKIIATLVAMSIVDEAGERVFSDDDAPVLAKKNPRALRRVFDAALELNAMTADELQDVAKN